MWPGTWPRLLRIAMAPSHNFCPRELRPKTLCNACGVRRQRLMRKQQAAVLDASQIAVATSVQARRRHFVHVTVSTSLWFEANEARLARSRPLPYSRFVLPLQQPLSEDMPVASEPSSEEEQGCLPMAMQPPLQLVTMPALVAPVGMAPEPVEGGSEADESAALDLLFFANGAASGDALRSTAQGSGWRREAVKRRAVNPPRRGDDFVYYEDSGTGAGAAAAALGAVSEPASYVKRRRVVAPPRITRIGPPSAALPGPSISSASEVSGRPPAGLDAGMAVFVTPAPQLGASCFPGSLPSVLTTSLLVLCRMTASRVPARHPPPRWRRPRPSHRPPSRRRPRPACARSTRTRSSRAARRRCGRTRSRACPSRPRRPPPPAPAACRPWRARRGRRPRLRSWPRWACRSS